MRRPIRTRRLSIAAIEACALFVLLSFAGIRSFWTWDALSTGSQAIGLMGGYLVYTQASGKGVIYSESGHLSGSMQPHLLDMPKSFLGFAAKTNVFSSPFGIEKDFALRVPLWFPLFLLLVYSGRWLIARPANTPAFQVIAKQP